VVYAYLLAVIALGYDLFYLTPDASRIAGVQISDMGLVLIFIGVAYYLLRGNIVRPLRNFFTWYTIFYLLLVTVQVSVAAFKYSQPISDGILVARTQLYYLSFPLFLLALDDLEKLKIFMTILSILALVIVALAMVNYFGVTVFSQRRAEGHGVRAGIVRAYIPSMHILVITALWQFWGYLKKKQVFSLQLAVFLVTYGAIVFRQTRGRIIAVTTVLILMLIAERRFRTLVAAAAIAGVILIASMVMSDEQNLLTYAFTSAYSDLTQGEGSWGNRMRQVQDSWEIFVRALFTGSGGLVIRGDQWLGTRELLTAARGSDLGYWVWLKYFGYPGFVYLTALVIGFYWYVVRCGRSCETGFLGQFAAYHFLSILISLVTLNYLVHPDGIIMVCLTWAILVKAVQIKESVSANATEHLDSSRLCVADDTADALAQLDQQR
jgi:hypothetical protein